MELLKNIVVTKVNKVFVVNSGAGRQVSVTNRPVYGLSLCRSGQITYTMDGETHISKPGVAVLLPKGGNYTLHGDKEGLFPVINFQCQGLDCTRVTSVAVKDPEVCLELFEEMSRLSLLPENRLEVLSVFYKLLGNLYSGNNPKPLLLINKYLEKNLSDPTISNTRLAEEMGISEVYLRKLFIRYYRTTPKQYILELRLRRAKQLLADTDFSVTQIARQCGFSSVYHFCRSFKGKVGITPTEYAQRNRIYQI